MPLKYILAFRNNGWILFDKIGLDLFLYLSLQTKVNEKKKMNMTQQTCKKNNKNPLKNAEILLSLRINNSNTLLVS